MNQTYFDYLHKYKIKKLRLITKLKKRQYIFLFDFFFYQIPIIWKLKLSLQKILIFRMNIVQKLFFPFSICKNNQIMVNEIGSGKILTYLIPIIEKNKSFFLTHYHQNINLILFPDSRSFFQVYKILLFFSKENPCLLFMIMLSSSRIDIILKFLQPKLIIATFKSFPMIYDYYINALKLFQLHFDSDVMIKAMHIIKKAFKKNTKYQIVLFTYMFSIPTYYTINTIPKTKYLKFYNFTNVFKAKMLCLYFLHIHRNKWLHFLLSVLKVNPNNSFLVVFYNKKEAMLAYLIMQQLFTQKKILYLFEKENPRYIPFKTSTCIYKQSFIIITDIKSVDHVSEAQVNWILILTSSVITKNKKLEIFFKKIALLKLKKNIILISPVKNKSKCILNCLLLYKKYEIKKLVLLNFCSFIKLVVKKNKYFQRNINKFLKYLLLDYLYFNEFNHYNELQKILTYFNNHYEKLATI